jgi:O-6-methylguanine DNA methyltransferase
MTPGHEPATWPDDPADPLAAGLAALATNGPPGLLERIAASWSRVPGPTCDLYVASTHLGVAYVRTSDAVHDDAAEFAALFHSRFTRPLVAAPHPPTELLQLTSPPAALPPAQPQSALPTTLPPIPQPSGTQPPTTRRLAARLRSIQQPAPQPPATQPPTAQPAGTQPTNRELPTPQSPSVHPSLPQAPAAQPATTPAPEGASHPARLRFDLSRLSAFEREVLLAVLTIPRGQVRPHAWIAHQIGRPTTTPDIDITLSRNPVPILIPCHRVINADGSLGNHVFGPLVKRALLDAEGTNVGEVYQLAQLDIHYVASDIAGVVCFPTCPDARRTDHAHRHGFPSVAQAEDAGYRPCPTCRPVSNEVG